MFGGLCGQVDHVDRVDCVDHVDVVDGQTHRGTSAPTMHLDNCKLIIAIFPL